VGEVHHLTNNSAGALGPTVHIWETKFLYSTQYPTIMMTE